MADSNINGLSTPALKDGFYDALAELPKPADRSSLDIAAGIEHKIKALVEQLQSDDTEIDSKLESLAAKLQRIRDLL